MIRAVLITVLSVLATTASADAAFLSAVNTFRTDAGRTPVIYSNRLEALAQIHADDMRSERFFSHTGSDGSRLGDRARRVGYGFCFIAENLAMGQKNHQIALQSWIDSASHRRNMLDRRATEIGLAQAPGAIWVMVLARPGC